MVPYRFMPKTLLTFSAILILLSAACRSAAPGSDVASALTLPASPPAEDGGSPYHAENATEEVVSFDIQGVNCYLNKPQNWEVHMTEHGVILAERVGSISTGGELEGLLAYFFVPSLEDYTLPLAENMNMAWSVLRQVTQKTAQVKGALVSDPMPFQWGDYDAAYYLLNDGNGTLTLVLATTIPETNQLLAVYISAPVQRAYIIRPMLPEILDGLTINGMKMDNRALDSLPNPLIFPGPNFTSTFDRMTR